MGDRTGQAGTLASIAKGVSDLVADKVGGLRSLVPDGIGGEPPERGRGFDPLTAAYTPTTDPDSWAALRRWWEPPERGRGFDPLTAAYTPTTDPDSWAALRRWWEARPLAKALRGEPSTPEPAAPETPAVPKARTSTPSDWRVTSAGRGVEQTATPVITGNPELDAILSGSGAADERTRVAGALMTPEMEAAAQTASMEKLKPGYVSEYSRDVEDRAREAYAVPEELKELYRSRIAELETPMYTPEEERRRSLGAFLEGLASSNLLAESGPAASRGMREVEAASRGDAKERARNRFELASALYNTDREASISAFNSGLDATKTAMNQQGVALQSLVSMLNAANQREQAAIIQDSQNRVSALTARADALQEASRMGLDRGKEMVKFNADLMLAANNITRAIAEIRSSAMGGELTPELQAALSGLNAQLDAINELAGAVRNQAADALGVEQLSDSQQLIREMYSR